MCRFVLYQGHPIILAHLITDPVNSLINQAVHSREQADPVNGDGFGIAWYAPEISWEPGLFRSLSPAWNNDNLLELARVTRSECMLAHVRRASTSSPIAELNCHPFKHGRYAFMHNGDLPGFTAIRRRILDGLSDESFNAIRGNTDSEHLFAVFLDRMKELGRAEKGAEGMAEAMAETVNYAVGLSRSTELEKGNTFLNLAVSNGLVSVACRYTTGDPEEALSLHVHFGKRYVCEKGVCRMVQHEEGRGAVLISSEPLSDDPGWAEIPCNSLVLVSGNLRVETRPFPD